MIDSDTIANARHGELMQISDLPFQIEQTAPTAQPGTLAGRRAERRSAILNVARSMFVTKGYAATSMSAIAARLGGSKGTLYNYFSSKEALFEAFMADMFGDSTNELFAHLPPDTDELHSILTGLGSNLLTLALGDDVLSIHRLVIAEVGRFPELGRTFYATGPRLEELKLSEYFKTHMDAGKIRTGDPYELGRRFKDLLLSDLYCRRLWGAIDRPTPEQLKRHVTESVDLFLALFGV